MNIIHSKIQVMGSCQWTLKWCPGIHTILKTLCSWLIFLEPVIPAITPKSKADVYKLSVKKVISSVFVSSFLRWDK